jgi:hypothetical protein
MTAAYTPKLKQKPHASTCLGADAGWSLTMLPEWLE